MLMSQQWDPFLALARELQKTSVHGKKTFPILRLLIGRQVMNEGWGGGGHFTFTHHALEERCVHVLQGAAQVQVSDVLALSRHFEEELSLLLTGVHV